MVLEQSACCKKRGVCTNKKYITYFIQMCVSYIFTRIYMYIFTHTGFNLLSGGWGLGHCSTNFRWYRYITRVKKLGFDWLLTTYWCFTACLFVRVYRHSLTVSLWESPTTSHPWSEYWVVFDKFFRTSTLGQPSRQDLWQLYWSGYFSKDIWSGPFAILIIGFFRKQCWKTPFLVFPIFDPWFGAALSSVAFCC